MTLGAAQTASAPPCAVAAQNETLRMPELARAHWQTRQAREPRDDRRTETLK